MGTGNFATFGHNFGFRSLSYAVVEPFIRLLEIFTKKRSSSAAPWYKVQSVFRILDLEWPITSPDL